MVVAGFSGHTDLTKAAEISNDVRRVVKNLKECQDLALLYNQRERLFNMNVTQVCVRVCVCVCARTRVCMRVSSPCVHLYVSVFMFPTIGSYHCSIV